MAVLIATSGPALGAQTSTLRHARIDLSVLSPLSCEVTAGFTVESPGADIDHRLQVFEGAAVELREVTGEAHPAGPVTVVGRTHSLKLKVPGGTSATYSLRYRVTQPEGWSYRCPVWIPAVPTDGRSHDVVVRVTLPSGSSPSGGGLPALAWGAAGGTANLGHVPAVVRVPYTTAGGGPAAWDVARVMDLVALGTLVFASAVWVWRRKRR